MLIAHKTKIIVIELNINRVESGGRGCGEGKGRKEGFGGGEGERVGGELREVKRRTHLPEPDLRSYQISFNWTECHLQNGGALAGR